MTKRKKDSGPDHPNVVLPTPADIDRRYKERRGARAGIASRYALGSCIAPKSESEKIEDALQWDERRCKVEGCHNRLSGGRDTCWQHARLKRVSLFVPVYKPVPGLCNKPVKHGEGRTRGAICRNPADRCNYHKGIPDLPESLKGIL